MRFRYAFQKIVDLKVNEKTQAEWILSQAIGRMREEESSLTELQRAKTELQEELQLVSSSSTSVSNLLLMQSYVDHMEQRIQLKYRDVAVAKEAVQVKQDDLTGKMQQEKVWNMAKDKAYQMFTIENLKNEQNSLDEMATNRYKRPS